MSKIVGRNWGIKIYQENFNSKDEIISCLNSLMCSVALSPLHIDGFNEGKKSHYHAILRFSGNKSLEQICKISVDVFNSENFALKLDDIKGAYDYLCHVNQPDKIQYDINDIVYINCSSKDFENNTNKTINACMLLSLANQLNITRFSTFCDYLVINQMYDEFSYILKFSSFFSAYFRDKSIKE